MRAAQLAGNASHTAARVAAGLRPQWQRLENASTRGVASATGLAHGLWRGALRWCERHELRPRLVGLLTSGQAAGGWVARGALGSLRRLLLLARSSGGVGRAGGGGGSSSASSASSSTPTRRRAGARPAGGTPSGDGGGEQAAQLAQYDRVLRADDHYAVLELSPRCDVREVKGAFRRLARLLHPDKLGAVRAQLRKQPEAAFQKLQEAHEVLTDDRKRATYDLQRQGVYVNGNNHAGGGGGGGRGASPYGHSGRASPGAGYAGYGYGGGGGGRQQYHQHQHQSQQQQQQRYDPFASMRFDFEQATGGRRGAGQYRSQSFW